MWSRPSTELNLGGKLFPCCVNEAVITHYHSKVDLPVCFRAGGGHTSGTAVFWFQIRFDVDYPDQGRPAGRAWKQEAGVCFHC